MYYLTDETNLTLLAANSESAVKFIDSLLHDSYLFVMAVRHDPSLTRDAAFYQQGVRLVESVQRQLASQAVDSTFSNHIIYGQCGLLDDAVLNSAPAQENQVWLACPLQSLFVHSLNAGTVLPQRLRELLRKPAPDMRLLVLYQRIFAMGFGRHDLASSAARQQLTEEVQKRVPVFVEPLSLPLISHHHPRARATLLGSPYFWLVIVLVLTGGLLLGLQLSLQQLLPATMAG